jgi:addiction module HigA family antidote
MQQHNPPHPGALIQRTYIEPFAEITGNKIADRLGVARSTFNRLLNGVSDISPEMSLRLSRVLGGSAESWLSLQASYNVWRARLTFDAESLEPIDFNEVA